MTEEINFGNDLDVKTEDFEFDYTKGDDSDFQVEGRDPRMTILLTLSSLSVNPLFKQALEE